MFIPGAAMFAVAVTVAIWSSVLPLLRAQSVSVGIVEGPGGDVLQGFIDTAQAELPDITLTRIDPALAGAFEGLDLFMYVNAVGASGFPLSATARNNLLQFVEDGGFAYLGVNPGAGGSEIAGLLGASFGTVLSVQASSEVTALDNAIASGPFQPAHTYIASVFAPFDEPGVGTYIGQTRVGTDDLPTLLHVPRNAIVPGSGAVYLFAVEVPLLLPSQGPPSFAGHHVAMFQNVLVSIPEPSSLALLLLAACSAGFTSVPCATNRRRCL